MHIHTFEISKFTLLISENGIEIKLYLAVSDLPLVIGMYIIKLPFE